MTRRWIALVTVALAATGCVVWDTLTAPDARPNECVVLAGAVSDSLAAWFDSAGVQVAHNGGCRL